jgi:Fe-S cluster biogenesis protein NfuA/nitrite reductase/ring-hydroxylating ferredoxin subunit
VEPDLAEEPIARVERLLEEVEALADPEARAKATELVSAMLDLYGEGLDRIVERVSEHDDGALAGALAGDELVSHLLLLHGLHPVPVTERVRDALDGVRPYLSSHGGDVELLEVADGVARLRLEGSCSGCPSSTMTLKLAIEDAIAKSAPDIVEVVAEGAVAAPTPGPQLIQLEGVPAAGASASRASTNGAAPPEPAATGRGWAMAGGMPELAAGGRTTPLVKKVAGEQVLFVELAGSLYAYRPGCPECGDPLADATLERTDLTCPGCGNRYDAARAGRCLDRPDLHLEPVPLLLDDDGLVRVALGAPA